MRLTKKMVYTAMVAAICTIIPTSRSQAQIAEIIIEAVKAAIKAADLVVQKAQNATIALQNVQKEIENELSQTELGDIADWVQKQKDLYGDYFNELKEVKDVLTYYKRVTAIIDEQKQLVAEYKKAYSLMQQDSHFSPAEVAYAYTVFTGIIDESVKSLDQITNVLESFTTSMTDAERLKILNQCSDGIERQIMDLHAFNNQSIQISLQRAKSLDELGAVRKLYGL